MPPGTRPSTEGPQRRIAESRRRTNLQVTQFPDDLGDYHISLSFYKYDYSSAQSGAVASDPIYSVALPVPTNILDASRIEVGGKQVGIMGAAAGQLASGLTNLGSIGAELNRLKGMVSGAYRSVEDGSARRAAGDAMENALESVMGNLGGAISAGGNVGLFLARAGLGKISPQIEQGIGAAIGSAVNPFTTLVFDGVDLKIHNLEWLLAPRNVQEQNTMEEIIRNINYQIHPEYKSPIGSVATGIQAIDRGLLDYPAMVKVKLVGLSGGFRYVFHADKFYMCNQFNVDYTPTGGLALNKGGHAAVVRCTMNLIESAIRTKRDYDPMNVGTAGEVNPATAAQAAAPSDTTEGVETAQPEGRSNMGAPVPAPESAPVTGGGDGVDQGQGNPPPLPEPIYV